MEMEEQMRALEKEYAKAIVGLLMLKGTISIDEQERVDKELDKIYG